MLLAEIEDNVKSFIEKYQILEERVKEIYDFSSLFEKLKG